MQEARVKEGGGARVAGKCRVPTEPRRKRMQGLGGKKIKANAAFKSGSLQKERENQTDNFLTGAKRKNGGGGRSQKSSISSNSAREITQGKDYNWKKGPEYAMFEWKGASPLLDEIENEVTE